MGDVLNRGTRDNPRWYCRFVDEHGKRRQKATHQLTKAAAEKFLASIEARLANGQVGIVEPTSEDRTRRTITVAQIVDRFLGDVDGVPGYAPPRIKSIPRYRRQARTMLRAHVIPALGSRAAASVKPGDVEALRDQLLAEGGAAGSAVLLLARLSKVYNWARKSGLVDCSNPVTGVERPRPHASLDFLDKAEVGRLLARAEADAIAATDHDGRMRWPMVATAIFGGLRKGELFGMRWIDAALDAGRLDVLRSYDMAPKGGKPRHVPIHPELARALRWWRDRCPVAAGLVFPVRRAGERFVMGREDDMVGLGELLAAAACHEPADGKVWHFMRHSMAAHTVMSGASLYSVQRLLGHQDAKLTQRYAHLAPDFLAAEIARVAFPAPALAEVTDIAEARRARVSTGGPDHRRTTERTRSEQLPENALETDANGSHC